ncbi:hypothetical protein EV715DRAFT_294113 [Schizophyllum commune]
MPETSTVKTFEIEVNYTTSKPGAQDRPSTAPSEYGHLKFVPECTADQYGTRPTEESALLAWRARGENVHERDVVPLREHRRRRNHQRWRAGGNQAALQVDLVVDVLLRETWDQKGRRTAQMKAHTGGDESRAWAEPLAPSLRL